MSISSSGTRLQLKTVDGSSLKSEGACKVLVRLAAWVCSHQFMVAHVDMPILGADVLLDHGMIINMAKRQLDWIGGTLPLTVVAEQVYCILKEDLNSVGMERQIVMACFVDGEGQAVHGLGNCLLEPNQRFMDRTEVLVVRVLVDTTFAKVPV